MVMRKGRAVAFKRAAEDYTQNDISLLGKYTKWVSQDSKYSKNNSPFGQNPRGLLLFLGKPLLAQGFGGN
jgi:hypothetical protein